MIRQIDWEAARHRQDDLITKWVDRQLDTTIAPSQYPALPTAIICSSCGEKFSEVIGATQASDCSAEIHSGMIFGFYGSVFIDGQRWKILDSSRLLGPLRNGLPPDGIICDRCIAELMLAGRLEFDGYMQIES